MQTFETLVFHLSELTRTRLRAILLSLVAGLTVTLATAPASATVMDEEQEEISVGQTGTGADEDGSELSPVLVGGITLDEFESSNPEDAYRMLTDNLEAFDEDDLQSEAAAELVEKYQQATTLISQGDHEAAEKLLREILTVAPGHARANTMLGVTQYMRGNLEEADAILGERATDPLARKYRAAAQLRMNNPEDALEILQNGEGLEPNDPDVLTMLGVARLAQGDREEGIGNLRDALQLRPDQHELRLRLAQYLIATGDVAGASEELEFVPEGTEFGNRADQMRIGVYAQSGRVEEASSLADSWVERAPEDTRALTVSAGIALLENERDKGRDLLERAVAAEPENVVAYTYLGNLTLAAEDYETAENSYSKALELVPENVTALKGLVTVAEARGDVAPAIAYMEEQAAANPQALAPRLVHAEYLLRNNQIDAALPLAEQGYALNTEATYGRQVLNTVLFTMARQAATTEDYDVSRGNLNRMLEITPGNVPALALLANIEATDGNSERARAVADELEERYPEQHFAGEIRGDIALREGDNEAAAAAYADIWAKTRNRQLAVKLMSTHRAIGRYDEAVGHLETWATEEPASGTAGMMYAEALLTSNRKEDAINEYERVLAANQPNAVALNNLAWLYYETGNEAAEETARRAHDLAPQSPDVLDTLAWILVEKGDTDEGVTLLEQAAELSPGNLPILQHLRDALDRAGNADRAGEVAAQIETLES